MKKTKILFLSASPKDASQLRLGKELREIKDTLNGTSERDKFTLLSESAVNIDTLLHALQKEKPEIVHFSGHGSEQNGLLLESEDGYSEPIQNKELDKLFSLFKNKIKCVILNACYSKEQAKIISNYGIHVVGMNKAIDDDIACKFSTTFYQSLGEGNTYNFAFQISLIRISQLKENSDIPELWYKGQQVVDTTPIKVSVSQKSDNVSLKEKSKFYPKLLLLSVFFLILSILFINSNFWKKNYSQEPNLSQNSLPLEVTTTPHQPNESRSPLELDTPSKKNETPIINNLDSLTTSPSAPQLSSKKSNSTSKNESPRSYSGTLSDSSLNFRGNINLRKYVDEEFVKQITSNKIYKGADASEITLALNEFLKIKIDKIDEKIRITIIEDEANSPTDVIETIELLVQKNDKVTKSIVLAEGASRSNESIFFKLGGLDIKVFNETSDDYTIVPYRFIMYYTKSSAGEIILKGLQVKEV